MATRITAIQRQVLYLVIHDLEKPINEVLSEVESQFNDDLPGSERGMCMAPDVLVRSLGSHPHDLSGGPEIEMKATTIVHVEYKVPSRL